MTSTFARFGSAEEAPSRASAEIRIVGRLDARPRILREGGQTTIVGLLTDESGLPVSGQVEPVRPSSEAFTSCLPKASGRATSGVRVDESGRFCLRTDANDTEIVLRLSAEGYRTREVELSRSARAVAPPRILSSPDVVDLDARTTVDVEAALDDSPDDEMLELRLDCQGEQRSLARTGAKAGRARFQIPTGQLPGPGACALVVRAGADSIPRPILLQAPAVLTSPGWSTKGGRAHAVVQARLRWQQRERPLDVGVLEGDLAAEHVFTAPLSAVGEARVELDEPPKAPVSIRLARAPAYVRAPKALTLLPPSPWQGWRVLEGAGLLGLALWLVLSWRSTEKNPALDVVLAPAASPRSAKGGALAGRVLDAHTGRPVAAVIQILAIGPESEELVLTTESNSDGAFQVQSPPGVCRYRAAADGYLDLDGPLSAGPAVIRLVSRRRAPLSLLASWFRRATPEGPIPTPQELRRSAVAQGRPAVAEWADELARAAYAPSPPSDADLSALAERKPS